MNLFLQFAQAVNYYDGPASSYSDTAAEAGVIAAIFGFMLLTILITYAVVAYLLSRIFKKAGVESWKAWVPIYNNWILLELGRQQGFWAVLAIIPVVNIISAFFMIIAMYHIGLKLGKEGIFVLLAIFLPIVWYAWLAFDKSTWNDGRDSTNPTNPGVPPYQPPTTPPTAS